MLTITPPIGLCILCIILICYNVPIVKPFCRVFYSIVCRYLSHIVTVDNALDLLSGHMTNYQTVLIQTWIRCAMFVPSASQQLQALNRYTNVREYQRGNEQSRETGNIGYTRQRGNQK